MQDKGEWTTSITDIAPNRICYRGIPVGKLMGNASFAEIAYLLLTGRRPSTAAARVFEAVLVASADHGVTPPSTIAARTATSTGAPINAALACGLLAINEYHGGAIERCARQLQEVAAAEAVDPVHDPREGAKASRSEQMQRAAKAVVGRHRSAGERLSGFGHRVHQRDPRAARLLEMIEQEGIGEAWIERARALERELAESAGKQLGLNVDGAIAIAVCSLELPLAAANALFMIARMPGLLAHVLEERTTQRPMRRIDTAAARYQPPDANSRE